MFYKLTLKKVKANDSLYKSFPSFFFFLGRGGLGALVPPLEPHLSFHVYVYENIYRILSEQYFLLCRVITVHSVFTSSIVYMFAKNYILLCNIQANKRGTEKKTFPLLYDRLIREWKEGVILNLHQSHICNLS